MAVFLSPVGGVAAQFFTNSGAVLTGGKLYSYAAGTTTPVATYTSSSGSISQANPIILDAAGRVPSGEIWLTDGVQYKFVLMDSNNVLIATYDNIIGINSNFINFTNQEEIQTATAGQTVFTLTTMQYQPATGSLSVFVDGVNQYGPGASYAYAETSSTVVTFVSGLHVGASVKFTTSSINASSYGDASQIAYTPAGTGAVTTNVQTKLRQTVSVIDFGATGNGTTDDTAAIQAAINALATTGGIVLIPPGIYKVSSTLNIVYVTQSFDDWRDYPISINLQGNGKSSQLHWYGGNNTSVVQYKGDSTGTGSTSKTFIRDFYIENANASTGLRGITLGDETQPNILGIVNCTITGMAIFKCSRAINVQYQSHECLISGNHLSEYTDYGVWLTSNGCVISNNHFQAGANSSIGIYGDGVGLTISSNTIESGAGGSCVFLENTGAFTISNNYTEMTENTTSGSNFGFKLLGCFNGYIGQNEFGGFPACNIIYIGQVVATGSLSRNIQIGSNNYATSGSDAAYFLYVEPASNNGINIVGRLMIDIGSTPETNSQWTSYLRQNGVRATFGGGSLDYVNIPANSVITLFNCLSPAVYFVNVSQGTENLIASGIVSMAIGAASAILFKTGSTNDSLLEIRVGSGTAVNIFNGVGAIRTVNYTVTRIA